MIRTVSGKGYKHKNPRAAPVRGLQIPWEETLTEKTRKGKESGKEKEAQWMMKRNVLQK